VFERREIEEKAVPAIGAYLGEVFDFSLTQFYQTANRHSK
jgi:hypothetical protein